MISVSKKRIAFALVSMFAFKLAWAQTSAGQMLQQIESLRPAPEVLPEPQPETATPAKEPEAIKAEQAVVVIKAFRFEGNELIGRDALEQLVAPYLNRALTFDDLVRITELITAYYQEQGWLARATLPPQDVTNGVLIIRILEGRFSRIIIDNQSQRISDERINSWIYANLPQGSDLQLNQLDRAILTLNDQPDLNVTASLREGQAAGETELLVTVTDRPRIEGMAAIDNFGDQNTGKARGAVSANVNGIMGIGDQANVYALYTQGSAYGRIGYTLPVGSHGLRVGVNGSSMSYRVINQSFQTLGNNGSSATGGVEASYPLYRSRPSNLLAQFYWNYSSFRNWNYQGSQSENTYDTSVAQLGVVGNLIDGFAGGGLNNLSLMASGGDISKDAWSQTGRIVGVAGTFVKLRYGYNRLQSIGENGLAGYFAYSGQVASHNMDSSEQLYLGGPQSVRAYSSGQGAATQGNLATIELRQVLPYQMTVAAFYDIGNVQTWKFNTQNIDYNSYILQGFGATLGWNGPHGLIVKGVWAQRTGNLTQGVSTYLSQNGGTSTNRIWLNASIPF